MACAEALVKDSRLHRMVQTETALLALPSSLRCLRATNWLSGRWSGICEARAGRGAGHVYQMHRSLR